MVSEGPRVKGENAQASGRRSDAAECEVVSKHRKVCRCEFVSGELLRRHPGEGNVLRGMGLRAVGGQAGEEGQELDAECWVGVCVVGEGDQPLEAAMQFLGDFAFQGLLRGFSGFDLAPGELPDQGQVLVGRSPGEEHAAVALDEGADDRDGPGGRVGREAHGAREKGGIVQWPATSTADWGVEGMKTWTAKTWISIALVVLGLVFVVKFWPFVVLALGVAGAAVIAFGSVLASVFAALLGGVLALALGVFAAALATVLVFSPLWVPILAIFGLVVLLRRAAA
jgi:hypothetical protein